MPAYQGRYGGRGRAVAALGRGQPVRRVQRIMTDRGDRLVLSVSESVHLRPNVPGTATDQQCPAIVHHAGWAAQMELGVISREGQAVQCGGHPSVDLLFSLAIGACMRG